MNAEYMRFSAYIDNLVLAASVAETITKPSAYDVCVLTADDTVWLRRGGTAAVPSGDVVDGTGSRMIPAGSPTIINFNDGITRGVTSDLATCSIIAAGATKVSLEWFAS